jgi:hypothetical protein
MEWPGPNDQDFLHRQLVRLDLIRPINIFLSCRTSLFRFSIEDDSRSSFWDEEEVEELDQETDDHLGPKDPYQGRVFFEETTNDGADDAAPHRGEDEEGDGVFLVVLRIEMDS